MLNNTEVAQAFARGERNAKGNNMFVEDGVVYSWGTHFPIAVWCGNQCLFNSDGYSSSTGRHKNLVWTAIQHALKGSELIYASTKELIDAIHSGVAIVMRDKELNKSDLKEKLLQHYKSKGVNTLKAKNHINRFFDEMDKVELMYAL